MSWDVARGNALLAVLVVVVAPGRVPAQESKQAAEPDLNAVSMEVNALGTLASFKFTEEQLRKLQGWARETASKPRKREAANASKEYSEKLMELHAALVEATDDDRIDQLSEELQELRTKENPTLDDGVDLSDVARSRSPRAFRLLKLHQVTDYIAAIAAGLVDPLDRLIDSLQSVRGLAGNAWKQRRQEITDDIVRLAAGVDTKKADKLADQIDALLTRAHGMNKAEFKKKQAELETTARKLLASVGPLDVLRNEVEYALAELLANPRLSAALAARLKNAK
jgi:hypothetical protein